MKRLIAFGVSAMATSTAFAGVQPYIPDIPVAVPEPGTFGLFAMASAALLIAARFKARK